MAAPCTASQIPLVEESHPNYEGGLVEASLWGYLQQTRGCSGVSLTLPMTKVSAGNTDLENSPSHNGLCWAALRAADPKLVGEVCPCLQPRFPAVSTHLCCPPLRVQRANRGQCPALKRESLTESLQGYTPTVGLSATPRSPFTWRPESGHPAHWPQLLVPVWVLDSS